MDYKNEFNRIMEKELNIALASCVDNIPNVRIVNFCYDFDKKVLYFSSFAGNPKTKEFEANSSVSFTTIPEDGSGHVRVYNGKVKKSPDTIFDLKDIFVKKHPDYEMIIANAGDKLVLYEISFDKALVTLDFTKSQKISTHK